MRLSWTGHGLPTRRSSCATAMIAPFSYLRGVVEFRINDRAGEVLALVETAGTPFEPVLLALHAIDRRLRNDFGDLHHLAEQMLARADEQGEVHPGVEVVAVLLPSRPPAHLKIDADMESILETTLAHRSDRSRGWGSLLSALRTQRTGNPDEMLTMTRQVEQLLVVRSPDRFTSLLSTGELKRLILRAMCGDGPLGVGTGRRGPDHAVRPRGSC